jgi:undecaprenyl phosphate-alpha-L-ara4FN deformylase
MSECILYLKIDVDTERGTRVGVPQLLETLQTFSSQATFLFSLGPDHTGWAIKRIFRQGFFKKVSRSNLLKIYGFKTLTHGLLRPGPQIGRMHADLMRSCEQHGHEVGIHCYDHFYWQNALRRMTEPQVRTEMNRATSRFREIFGRAAHAIGAAGWQANRHSLVAQDDFAFLYASDTRGDKAFFPKIKGRTCSTLQIPTTLPTLDELVSLGDCPEPQWIARYLEQIHPNTLNVLTIHAEWEGMTYHQWFVNFLETCVERGIQIRPLKEAANMLLSQRSSIPVLHLVQKTIEGRSGPVATHES